MNEIIQTPYHNTLCLQCNIVCHERCSLTETLQTGERVLRRCSVMSNGKCTVCPGKCSYDTHYHDRRLIKPVRRNLNAAISSLSDKYIEAENDRAACKQKCKNIQESKCLIERLLQEHCDKVHNACVRIQCSCEGFNIAEELYTFIRLLKTDINQLRSSTVVQKATDFIEKLEMLAYDSSLAIHEQSSSPINKKKIKPSKKRNQPQLRSTTATNDDLILCDEESTSMLVSKVDHNQSEILLFDDDLFSCIQNSQHQSENVLQSEKYTRFTTEQLIDLTRQSMERNVLIAKELNRRCQKASIGYLSATQLLTLCEYYASYRLLRLDELNRLYAQFQLEIQRFNQTSSCENISTPSDLLLHLTAIKLCLENIDKY